MRTFTHVPRPQAALHLTLDVGNITVYAEDRPDLEIILEPADPDDKVAVDRITRTMFDAVNDQCVVRVPEQPQQVRNITTGSTQVITAEGAISVVARMPLGSDLAAWTTSADVDVYGEMREVKHHTVSGDLAVAHAGVVQANGTDGDVDIDRVAQADVVTISGAVDVRQLTKSAIVSTVAGDVNINSVANSSGHVSTVGGDIRLTTMAGARTEITTRTVSGDVRRPNSVGVL